MSTEEQQKAIQKINAFKNDYQMMSERLSEVQLEYSEHMAVLDALKGLEKGRKCHRLIGGVLVERTVEQVVPAIETNLAGLTQLIEKLKGTLKENEKMMEKLEKEFASASIDSGISA